MKMNEIWKPVVGYEGLYEVSNYGKVRSLPRKVVTKAGWCKELKGRIVRPELNDGYYYISICKNGKPYKAKVHRLVATAFIPNPDNLPIINHIDENKLNNYVGNLEWCTKWHNEHCGNYCKLVSTGKDKYKKPILQYDMGGNLIRRYESVSEARKAGHDCKSLILVCKGKARHHHGFVFRYE